MECELCGCPVGEGWCGNCSKRLNAARDKRPTKAQKRVFNELMDRGEFRCVERYKPALALIDMGLAEVAATAFGTMTLRPTDKARAADQPRKE